MVPCCCRDTASQNPRFKERNHVRTNLLDLWIDFRKTAQREGIDQGCFYLHTQNAPKPIRDDFRELFESLCQHWEEQRLQRAADDALVDELLADDALYFPPTEESATRL